MTHTAVDQNMKVIADKLDSIHIYSVGLFILWAIYTAAMESAVLAVAACAAVPILVVAGVLIVAVLAMLVMAVIEMLLRVEQILLPDEDVESTSLLNVLRTVVVLTCALPIGLVVCWSTNFFFAPPVAHVTALVVARCFGVCHTAVLRVRRLYTIPFADGQEPSPLVLEQRLDALVAECAAVGEVEGANNQRFAQQRRHTRRTTRAMERVARQRAKKLVPTDSGVPMFLEVSAIARDVRAKCLGCVGRNKETESFVCAAEVAKASFCMRRDGVIQIQSDG